MLYVLIPNLIVTIVLFCLTFILLLLLKLLPTLPFVISVELIGILLLAGYVLKTGHTFFSLITRLNAPVSLCLHYVQLHTLIPLLAVLHQRRLVFTSPQIVVKNSGNLNDNIFAATTFTDFLASALFFTMLLS